jgi:hypothetical protein
MASRSEGAASEFSEFGPGQHEWPHDRRPNLLAQAPSIERIDVLGAKLPGSKFD